MKTLKRPKLSLIAAMALSDHLAKHGVRHTATAILHWQPWKLAAARLYVQWQPQRSVGRLMSFKTWLKQRRDLRSCRICGCTQDDACPGGCYWVDEDLCSACVHEAQPTNPTRQRGISR